MRAQLPVFTGRVVAAGAMRIDPVLLQGVFHMSPPSYRSGWFSPAGSSNRCVQIPGYYRPRRGMVKPFRWRIIPAAHQFPEYSHALTGNTYAVPFMYQRDLIGLLKPLGSSHIKNQYQYNHTHNLK
jgi:hypothetical protein